jgi:hypothetical protein
MAGTITHQQGHLIEDCGGKGTTLDTDALLNKTDLNSPCPRALFR